MRNLLMFSSRAAHASSSSTLRLLLDLASCVAPKTRLLIIPVDTNSKGGWLRYRISWKGCLLCLTATDECVLLPNFHHWPNTLRRNVNPIFTVSPLSVTSELVVKDLSSAFIHSQRCPQRLIATESLPSWYCMSCQT